MYVCRYVHTHTHTHTHTHAHTHTHTHTHQDYLRPLIDSHLMHKFPSHKYIANVSAPVLMLHGRYTDSQKSVSWYIG